MKDPAWLVLERREERRERIVFALVVIVFVTSTLAWVFG